MFRYIECQCVAYSELDVAASVDHESESFCFRYALRIASFHHYLYSHYVFFNHSY